MARVAHCASCSRSKKIAARGLCWACYASNRRGGTLDRIKVVDDLPKRDPNGCVDCGKATTKRDGVCRRCTRVRQGVDDGEIALTGGSWVLDPRSRVMRWRAA